MLENVAVNSAVTAKVKVEDEKLNLNITAPDATLCLNLAYIKIYLPDTLTPESFVKTASTESNMDADATETIADADTDNKKNEDSSVVIYIIVAVVVVVLIGGIVYTKKKKGAKA